MRATQPDRSPDDRIVVLTRRGDLHYLLINRLAERYPIAAVVLESDRSWIRRTLLRRRMRTLGWPRVLGQLLYLAYERYLPRGGRTRCARLLAGCDLRPPDGRFPILEAGRINDPDVSDLLQRERPRVVVVSGTTLLRKRILAQASCFLNIHCGITPRYRGVYGAYWAVFEGHPEAAGVTIHKIDAGVDTGAIADQARIDVEPNDGGRTLVAKQYLVGSGRMVEAVARALREEIVLSPAAGEGKQWYHPTIWDERRFRRQLRVLKLRSSRTRRHIDPDRPGESGSPAASASGPPGTDR